jgi:Rrf2 family protein
MSKLVTLTEAASIAIHGMILIARTHGQLNVTQIADQTTTSRNHAAKVFQRLVKDGFLTSNRGPSGGFKLAKPADKITLLEIYESIEGKIEISTCPMDKQVCPFDKCFMNNITGKMTAEFREFLGKQTLADYIVL